MIRFKDAGEPRGTNGKSFVEINDRDSFEYIIRLIHSIIFFIVWREIFRNMGKCSD